MVGCSFHFFGCRRKIFVATSKFRDQRTGIRGQGSCGCELEQGREFADQADGFEADGDDLADETDDVFGIVRAVGVVDDAGALVGGDAVLVYDRFEGAAVAEAVFVDFGRRGRFN
jgi:hypothetical protein